MRDKFLTFMLGQEEYGIEADYVQEIRDYETVAPIA